MASVIFTLGYLMSAMFSRFAWTCVSWGDNVSYDFYSLISPTKLMDFQFTHIFVCLLRYEQTLPRSLHAGDETEKCRFLRKRKCLL